MQTHDVALPSRVVSRLRRARMQDGVSGHALLILEAVLARVGLGRSTLYAMVKAGTFPAPIKLSPRCVRWRASDVEAWLDAHSAQAEA